MSHLISVELEDTVVKSLVRQLEKMPLPPLDEDEEAQYKLYVALEEALQNDDA